METNKNKNIKIYCSVTVVVVQRTCSHL